MANRNDADIGPNGAWAPHTPVYHCEGGIGAFATIRSAHHYWRAPYEPCWRCNHHLGCLRCLGGGLRGERGSEYMIHDLTEIWCGRCGVWQTAKGLLTHGIAGTSKGLRIILGNHRQEWIAAFRRIVASGELFQRNDPVLAYMDEKRKMGTEAHPDRDQNLLVILRLWETFKRRQFEAIAELDTAEREIGMEG